MLDIKYIREHTDEVRNGLAKVDPEGALAPRLDEALTKLGRFDPGLLRVCELRFLIGFGVEETRYRIGIRGSEALVAGVVVTDRVRNPLVALPRAIGMTVDFTRVFLIGFKKIVTGEVSRKNLAGPIGIAQIAGSALKQGWEPYLRIMVLISINLGILNLLPIPVLDGGQAVVFLVEGIKRSPLSIRTRIAVQQVGVTVLVLLMGLAFWNDLSRIWTKVVDLLPGGGS